MYGNKFDEMDKLLGNTATETDSRRNIKPE